MRGSVDGAIALAYNSLSAQVETPSSRMIRLDNIPASSPIDIKAPGALAYTTEPNRFKLQPTALTSHPTLAFKYTLPQPTTLPLLLALDSKIEATVTSVRLRYKHSHLLPHSPITLTNVRLAIHLMGPAKRAQLKPVSGIFHGDQNTCFWSLPKLTINKEDQTEHKLLARFQTDQPVKVSSVSASWELTGESAAGLGTSVSIFEEREKLTDAGSDPFADDDAGPSSANGVGEEGNWAEVPGFKKIAAGGYQAVEGDNFV